MIVYLLFSLVAIVYGIFAEDWPGDVKQGVLFIGVAGCTIWTVALLQLGSNYRKNMQEMLVNNRGTTDIVQTTTRVDATGISESALDTETIYAWRSIRNVEVSQLNVLFYREPTAVLNVPLRVFPDAMTLEQFLALAEKYRKPQPARAFFLSDSCPSGCVGIISKCRAERVASGEIVLIDKSSGWIRGY